MRAELVVDLSDLGEAIGRASGRSVSVLPSLASIRRMWTHLGIEVTKMHIVAADFQPRAEYEASFNDLHAKAWWESERVFVEDEPFSVSFNHFASPAGDIARDALVVTTALSRSDALSAADSDKLVIVMSNRAGAEPAVTHAQGVPVMVAGTVITDPALAHVRLDVEWLSDLNARHSAMELAGVELRAGRPWHGHGAVATPYGGIEGRLDTDWSVSGFAKSIAIYDPSTFSLGPAGSTSEDMAPDAAGIATTIQRLGLGELVHVHTIDGSDPVTATASVATLYRYAADYPENAIIVASTRDALIMATSDLVSYSMPNPQRFIRLCVLEREITFDEEVYAHDRSACRMVLEQSQSSVLFTKQEESEIETSDRAVLTLVGNPNTVREDAVEWRKQSQRQFLMLGPDGAVASPTEQSSGNPLPVSLGGCSDFAARHPRLRPGAVVEGVRSHDGERWVIVSDPVERRRLQRDVTGDDNRPNDGFGAMETDSHAA